MDRTYVSDFTRFMDRFLAEHPEVVADQQRGWRIYWDKTVDLAALREAEEDQLPFDAYEYRPPASRHTGWRHWPVHEAIAPAGQVVARTLRH